MADGVEPTFLIVGAQKAGTNSLFHWLGQHPDIGTSSEKETHFFIRAAEGEFDAEDRLDDYRSYFEGAEDADAVGEADVQYLFVDRVPELIHETLGPTKIVVSLRDPIQRAYSNYWRKVAAATEPLDFDDAVEREIEAIEDGVEPQAMTPRAKRRGYLDRSLYADDVGRYIDVFGPDNVHVLLLADLRDAPRQTLRRICSFLGVDPDGVASIDTDRRRNTYRGVPGDGFKEWLRTSPTVKSLARAVLPESVRDYIGNQVLLEKRAKPPIPEETRHRLAKFFEPDIRQLEELLGRDLPELRASFPETAD